MYSKISLLIYACYSLNQLTILTTYTFGFNNYVKLWSRSKYGQFPASGFSLHDLIFVSLRLKLPKLKPISLLLISFKNLNIEKLKSNAMGIDWSQIEATRSIDEKVNWLNSNIIALLNKNAPRTS